METGLWKVPDHVIGEHIIPKLSISQVFRLRLTCKRLRDIVDGKNCVWMLETYERLKVLDSIDCPPELISIHASYIALLVIQFYSARDQDLRNGDLQLRVLNALNAATDIMCRTVIQRLTRFYISWPEFQYIPKFNDVFGLVVMFNKPDHIDLFIESRNVAFVTNNYDAIERILLYHRMYEHIVDCIFMLLGTSKEQQIGFMVDRIIDRTDAQIFIDLVKAKMDKMLPAWSGLGQLLRAVLQDHEPYGLDLLFG